MNLNYKNYFSIVLITVVNSNYQFIYVDIGSFCNDCDSSVFKETVFWIFLNEQKLNIPTSDPLN